MREGSDADGAGEGMSENLAADRISEVLKVGEAAQFQHNGLILLIVLNIWRAVDVLECRRREHFLREELVVFDTGKSLHFVLAV